MSIIFYLEAHTCPAMGSAYAYRDHFGSFIQTALSGISETIFIGPINEIQKLSNIHRKAVALIYNLSVKGRTVPLCRCPEAGWDTRCHGNPDTQVSGPK